MPHRATFSSSLVSASMKPRIEVGTWESLNKIAADESRSVILSVSEKWLVKHSVEL